MVSPGAGLSAVAIVGPTAVGKSDVADRLAARLSSEVLSCDAMQIYRDLRRLSRHGHRYRKDGAQ